MTSNPMITKDFLRTIHLYCYEDVQEFLSIHRALEEELEKPAEEMDMVLVEECLDYIDMVMSQDSTPDEETLDAKYQEVLAKASQHRVAEQPKAKIIGSKKRSARKFFFILAATITVLFTTLTIAARVNGYKNAWEFVYQKAIEIMGLDTGEIIEEEGITLICNEKAKSFASFESFLEEEGLDILYPQILPEHLKINNVFKHSFEDGSYSYIIQFNDEKVSIIISTHHSVELEAINATEQKRYNNIDFYIKKFPDNRCQAFCSDGTYEYTLNTSDYDTLLLFLQNMKG